MSPGPIDEIGKATGSFFDILRQQPLSLALVVMNFAMLVFFWLEMREAGEARARTTAMVSGLLTKCLEQTK